MDFVLLCIMDMDYGLWIIINYYRLWIMMVYGLWIMVTATAF